MHEKEPATLSIFQQYYQPREFIDRFEQDRDNAVDVLIPIIHTNELWRSNLLSYYREIPINRLLIGDGGCIDHSLNIVKEFPRVIILNHRSFKSLGYSIRKLIEAVETPWFIYLHSDVYLPPGWFAEMAKHQDRYDWFECRQQITILADYPLNYEGVTRPFSGSQMGKKSAFRDVVPQIDDDFMYRNEDIILADLLQKHGFRYGRVDSAFHFHQLMYKPSRWHRKISQVDIHVDKSPQEELREDMTQIKGLVKYTEPRGFRINDVQTKIGVLDRLGQLDLDELREFTRQTNPAWLPHIHRRAWWKRGISRLGLLVQTFIQS